MECKSGCGGAKSFLQLRADIQLAEKAGVIRHVPPELLMAIAVRESRGNRWFQEADLQFRENMVVAMRATKKSQRQLLEELREDCGNLYGRIPKFRYEPYFNEVAKRMVGDRRDLSHWEFRLSCSIGYFQKAMCFHLGAKRPNEWSAAYRLFNVDVNEQIKVADNDLRVLIQNTHGDVPLALSRYNAGNNAKVVTEYGNNVFQLYKTLLEEKHGGK